MNYELVSLIVPLGVCVVLPVLIIWIVFRAGMNKDNKRAAVIMKAIELDKGNIDVDRLAENLRDRQKTPRELLNARLLRGCIFTLVGVALTLCEYTVADMEGVSVLGYVSLAIGFGYLIVYFATRKQVAADEARQAGACNAEAVAEPALAQTEQQQ